MKESSQENQNRGKVVYCHFSFKRPKGKSFGIFAVAVYRDFAGKKLIVAKTRKYKLWDDHQFITAIQAYKHALLSIYEWQGMMFEAGIRQVMLVTDNSTLAGWIENPKKNKNYEPYMNRAVKMFKVGSPKEIVIGIGLCEPRDAEKSYKYCKEERVEKDYVPEEDKKDGMYKLKVDGYKSALDIINDDISVPETKGINEVII